jgi:transcriptional regulator with XRE-family HTH domain
MMQTDYALRLRAARERAGISQSKLARLSDTAQPQVNRYERGVTMPSLETRLRLAAALDDPDLRDLPDGVE